MERQQLETIMDELSNERKIFHSEADFQHSLSSKINELSDEYRVRLEVPRQLDMEKPGKLSYIDIVLINQSGQEIPIELKYRTRKFEHIDTQFYDEQFKLKNHGATDLGNYHGLKDISRIEDLFINQDNVLKGFTIFLTNEPKYWLNKENGSNDDEFKLYQGKTFPQGKFDWLNETKSNKKFPPLEIYWEHHMDWKTFSQLGNHQFKYLLTEIK